MEQCSLDVIPQRQYNDIIRYATLDVVLKTVKRYKELILGIDETGASPLMCAADRPLEHISHLGYLVQQLLIAGANFYAGEHENSPLCYAATKSPDVLSIFVQFENNWDIYDRYPTKPWQYALYTSPRNFTTILPYIPKHLINRFSVTGFSLLTEVVIQQPRLTPLVLCDRAFVALVNIPDEKGETPLSHAASLEKCRPLVTGALLEHGASLLFAKNGRYAFFNRFTHSSDDIDTVGLEYIRRRIEFPYITEPFNYRYMFWYNI